jgi:lysozyme
MTAEERLLANLRAHEGFRAFVYDDATGERIVPGTTVQGNPTIGYGWALNKRPMARVQAEVLLREMAQEVIFDVQHRLPWAVDLDDVRKVTLYELAYNLGIAGLLGFPKMLTALRRARWAEAGNELMDSKWAREDVSAERSGTIQHQIVTGTYKD